MKKGIIVLVISACSMMQAFTQSYLSIKPNSIAYYQGTTNKNVFPIRIDSTRINGANTEYYSFCMIRPLNTYGLYTLKGDPWIGKKAVNCGNGINLFFNKNYDTIVIKTNAQLSDTWRMFSFSNGDYVEAAITTFATESFLGLTDSVKTIALQLKNSSGTNLTDPINNLHLKLSKNYGFTLILDFYNFPYDPNSPTDNYNSDKNLTLIGLSNPMVGWQNITMTDVFSMHQGDEIHFHTTISNNVFEQKYIYKYLNVYFDLLTDSVHYTIERCSYYRQNMPPVSTTYHHDTIHTSYSIDSSLNSLPFEPTNQNGAYFYFLKNDSTVTTDVFNQYYHNTMYNHDTIDKVTSWEDPGNDAFYNVYFKGLGCVTNYVSYNMGSYNTNIVYYNLQGVQWGTPYNCGVLLSVSNNAIAEIELSIFPNPTNNNKVTINSSEIINSFVIINNLGEKMISEDNINSNTTIISSNKLQSGIYFIKIYCNNNQIYIKKLFVNNR